MSQNKKGILCLNVKDKWGKNIVFHEKHRIRKALLHKELNDLSSSGFVKKRIPEALLDPDFVYEDLTDANKKNYYKIYRRIDNRSYSIYFYTKVVVLTLGQTWVIITSYECQNMKEEGDIKKCRYQK